MHWTWWIIIDQIECLDVAHNTSNLFEDDFVFEEGIFGIQC